MNQEIFKTLQMQGLLCKLKVVILLLALLILNCLLTDERNVLLQMFSSVLYWSIFYCINT